MDRYRRTLSRSRSPDRPQYGRRRSQSREVYYDPPDDRFSPPRDEYGARMNPMMLSPQYQYQCSPRDQYGARMSPHHQEFEYDDVNRRFDRSPDNRHIFVRDNRPPTRSRSSSPARVITYDVEIENVEERNPFRRLGPKIEDPDALQEQERFDDERSGFRNEHEYYNSQPSALYLSEGNLVDNYDSSRNDPYFDRSDEHAFRDSPRRMLTPDLSTRFEVRNMSPERRRSISPRTMQTRVISPPYEGFRSMQSRSRSPVRRVRNSPPLYPELNIPGQSISPRRTNYQDSHRESSISLVQEVHNSWARSEPGMLTLRPKKGFEYDNFQEQQLSKVHTNRSYNIVDEGLGPSRILGQISEQRLPSRAPDNIRRVRGVRSPSRTKNNRSPIRANYQRSPSRISGPSSSIARRSPRRSPIRVKREKSSSRAAVSLCSVPGKRSPMKVQGRRSPSMVAVPSRNSQRSQSRAERRRSPSRVQGCRDSSRAHMLRSPSRAQGRRSPSRAQGRRSPSRAHVHRSPSRAQGRRSPSRAQGRRSSSRAQRCRSPSRDQCPRSPSRIQGRRSPSRVKGQRSPSRAPVPPSNARGQRRSSSRVPGPSSNANRSPSRAQGNRSPSRPPSRVVGGRRSRSPKGIRLSPSRIKSSRKRSRSPRRYPMERDDTRKGIKREYSPPEERRKVYKREDSPNFESSRCVTRICSPPKEPSNYDNRKVLDPKEEENQKLRRQLVDKERELELSYRRAAQEKEGQQLKENITKMKKEIPEHVRALPFRLYESDCFVVKVQDSMECGVVEVVGGNGTHVYAFFSKKEIISKENTDANLSKLLPVGLKLKANAWLIDNHEKIPYIISNMWFPDVSPEGWVLEKVKTEPSIDIRNKFDLFKAGLEWIIPKNRTEPRRAEEIVYYEDVLKKKEEERNTENSRKRKDSAEGIVVLTKGKQTKVDILYDEPNPVLHSAREKLDVSINPRFITESDAPRKVYMQELPSTYESNRNAYSYEPRTIYEEKLSAVSTNPNSIDLQSDEHRRVYKEGLPTESNDTRANIYMRSDQRRVHGEGDGVPATPEPPRIPKNFRISAEQTGREGYQSMLSQELPLLRPQDTSFNQPQISSPSMQSFMPPIIQGQNLYQPSHLPYPILHPPNIQQQFVSNPNVLSALANQHSSFPYQTETAKYLESRLVLQSGNATTIPPVLTQQVLPSKLVKSSIGHDPIVPASQTQHVNSSINPVLDQVFKQKAKLFLPPPPPPKTKSINQSILNLGLEHESIGENLGKQLIKSLGQNKDKNVQSQVLTKVPATVLSKKTEEMLKQKKNIFSKSPPPTEPDSVPIFGKQLPSTPSNTSQEELDKILRRSRNAANGEGSVLPLAKSKDVSKNVRKEAKRKLDEDDTGSVLSHTLAKLKKKEMSSALQKLQKVNAIHSQESSENNNPTSKQITSIEVDIVTEEDHTVTFGKPTDEIENMEPLEKFNLTIHSYTSSYGLMEISDTTSVFFHPNQVWIKSHSGQFCPFKELYPEEEIHEHFPIGKKLKCYAQKVSDIHYQAVKVWTFDATTDPITTIEGRKSMKKELEFLYQNFLTPTTIKFCEGIGNPDPTIDGTVIDYVTHEMGVILVDISSTQPIQQSVLFHLSQVWYASDSGSFITREDEAVTKPLEVILPVGTKVTFAYRELPTAETCLKYQALAVWDSLENSKIPGKSGSIFHEYKYRYLSKESQSSLVTALDIQHNHFKKYAKISEPENNLVPVILNGLPDNWKAEISHIYNDKNHGIGIIRISHRIVGTDMSSSLRANIKELYAVFNFKDVYSKNGDNSFGVQRFLKVSVPVNLVARSIICEDSAIKIFKVINLHNVMNSKLYLTMQAIQVTLEVNTNMPISMPRPVELKAKRISFNTGQTGTAFYMNLRLKDSLKNKLYHAQQTLKTKSSGAFDMSGVENFIRKPKTVSMNPDVRIQMFIDIDKQHSRELFFGKLKPHKSFGDLNLPQNLDDMPCKVSYIGEFYNFKPREGIVEIDLGTVIVQAYFKEDTSFGNWIPFSVVESPVYKKLSLRCSATLLDASSCLPYVCTMLCRPGTMNPRVMTLNSQAKCSYQAAIESWYPEEKSTEKNSTIVDQLQSGAGTLGKMQPGSNFFPQMLASVSQNFDSNPMLKSMDRKQEEVAVLKKPTLCTPVPAFGRSMKETLSKGEQDSECKPVIPTFPFKTIPISDCMSTCEAIFPVFGKPLHNEPLTEVPAFGKSIAKKSQDDESRFDPTKRRGSDLEERTESRVTSNPPPQSMYQDGSKDRKFKQSQEKELYNPEEAFNSDEEDQKYLPHIQIGLDDIEELTAISSLDEFENKVLAKKRAKRHEFTLSKKKLCWSKENLQKEMEKLQKKGDMLKCTLCSVEMSEKHLAEKHLRGEDHWTKLHVEYCKEIEKIKFTRYDKKSTGQDKPKAKNILLDIFADDDDCEVQSIPAPSKAKPKPIEIKLQFNKNEHAGTMEQEKPNVESLPLVGVCSGSQATPVLVQPENNRKNISILPPEIFLSTELKLKEVGNFPKKEIIIRKVTECLEGDARTLLQADFSDKDKEVLKIVNKAYNVCNKAEIREKEMNNLRIHFHEWQCKECHFSSRKKEMEEHLKSNEHWTKIINGHISGSNVSVESPQWPEIIGDAVGRVSMVINDDICIVTFNHESTISQAIMDLSGIEEPSRRRTQKKWKNMHEAVMVGYPVRMNVCQAFQISKGWYYVTAGYVMKDADWSDPLPKPETLMSIRFDEDRRPSFDKSVKYVDAMEEFLIAKLTTTNPEYYLDQDAKIIFTHRDYCVAEILTPESEETRFSLILVESMMKKGKDLEDLMKGVVLKVAAVLMDQMSPVSYLVYDFQPLTSAKGMEKLLRVEVSKKQISLYNSLKASWKK